MKDRKNNHKSLVRLLTFSLVILLSFGVISLSALGANGENELTLSVEDITADPGATISIPVIFTSDGEAAAIQAKLSYDATMLTYKGTSDGNLPGFMISGHNPDGKAYVNISVVAMGQQIPAGTYNIIYLNFLVKEDATPAETSTFELEALISDPSAQELTPDAINNGVFTVGGAMPAVTINPIAALNLKLGATETAALSVVTNPADATKTFVSNNTDIATVAANGTVTAQGVGTTTVTITASKAGYTSGSRNVTVNVTAGDMEITGLPASLSMIVGGSTEQLVPVAAGATFTYESSDTDVASVSAAGLVTPVAAGTTTITVTAEKDGFSTATATVSVTVIDSQALFIPDVTGDPGTTVEVPVMLNTVGLVAGMQFSLSYDPAILSYQGISDGALTTGFTVDAEPVSGGGKVNILIVDVPVTPIPTGSGSVAVLAFNVISAAQPGATSPLALSDIIFSNEEGDALPDNGSSNGLFTVTGEAVTDKLVLTAGTVTGRAGSNVSVPITLRSEGNVAGLQFALSYDPALLNYKDIEEGALTEDYTVEAEAVSGSVNVLLVKIPVTSIEAGQGTVAKINFTVVSGARTGRSCDLAFNNVTFSDDEGEPLIADKLNNGKFTVASSGGGGGGGGGGSSKDKDEDKEETPSQPECSFTDLTTNHWAYKDIIELCQAGIINGYPDGTFGPERSITRAEFAKIIVGVKGTTLVNPAQPTYQDAARNNWYYQYVETATQAGLVMGDGKGKFRPNDQISRQEIAIILVRAMGMQNEAAAKAQEMTSFGDDAQIAAWAKGHVVIAVEQGLINGYPGNPPTFKAKNTATRAEAATMLNRYRNQ